MASFSISWPTPSRAGAEAGPDKPPDRTAPHLLLIGPSLSHSLSVSLTLSAAANLNNTREGSFQRVFSSANFPSGLVSASLLNTFPIIGEWSLETGAQIGNQAGAQGPFRALGAL